MKRRETTESSIERLNFLFLPIVVRWIERRRRAKACEKAAKLMRPPGVDSLLKFPIFSAWTKKLGSQLLENAHLTFFKAGEVIAFNGEPVKTAELLWVLSGKLTELPTKKELMECVYRFGLFNPISNEETSKTSIFSSERSSSAPKHSSRSEFTGPKVIPQFYNKDSIATQPAISDPLAHDIVFGRLEKFAAGSLASSHGIILQQKRLRAIRCVTNVVACIIPLKALWSCLSEKEAAGVRAKTFEIAKSSMRYSLGMRLERPSLELVVKMNPVLARINYENLDIALSKLEPFVYQPNEQICTNIFTADKIFFLHSGSLSVVGAKKQMRYSISQKGAAVGLNAFVSYELPHSLGEALSVYAATYAELWGISFKTLLRCWQTERTSCVATARKMLPSTPNPHALSKALSTIPQLSFLSVGCLQQMVSLMKIRVHGPEECLVEAYHPISEGIILLVGKAHFVSIRKNEEQPCEPLALCRPYFFCEALAEKILPTRVMTETSVIVLHCAAASVVEAIVDIHGRGLELDQLYMNVDKYMLQKYGPPDSRSEAQQRAITRLKDYRRTRHPLSAELAEAERKKQESYEVELAVERAIVENELFSAIGLRILSFHQDPLVKDYRSYMNDVDKKLAPKGVDKEQNSNERSASFISPLPSSRLSYSQAVPENFPWFTSPITPPPKKQLKSYFTVDKNGNVVDADDWKEQSPRCRFGEDYGSNARGTSIRGESVSVAPRGSVREQSESHSTAETPSPSKKENGGKKPVISKAKAVVGKEDRTAGSNEVRSPALGPPRASIEGLLGSSPSPDIATHKPSSPDKPNDTPRPDKQPASAVGSKESVHESASGRTGKNGERSCEDIIAGWKSRLKPGKVKFDAQGRMVRSPTLPNRLEAIQQNVTALKNQMDGFDPRREYMRHMLKRPAERKG